MPNPLRNMNIQKVTKYLKVVIKFKEAMYVVQVVIMVMESVGGARTNSGAEHRVNGPRRVNNAKLKGLDVGSPVI